MKEMKNGIGRDIQNPWNQPGSTLNSAAGPRAMLKTRFEEIDSNAEYNQLKVILDNAEKPGQRHSFFRYDGIWI